MAFESVRSYVQLASGLGEMTMAKAMEAAQGLLALPGVDEVSRRAVQASTLADQLLEAARSNRANLVALVQAEVETALRRADVASLGDVDAARAALAGVTKELADLRDLVVATGVSAVSGAARGSAPRPSGAVSTSARPAAAPYAAAPAAVPTEPAVATKSTTAARKSTARKTAAKKSTARKTAAKKATARKTAAKKSTPAKKTTATKSTAKKSTASKSAARKTTATKSTPTKSTAQKTTAKKTGS